MASRPGRRTHFTQDEITTAVNAIKSERPDIWEKTLLNERNNLGHDLGIQNIVYSILKRAVKTQSLSEFTSLFMQLRDELTCEIDLPE